MKKIILSLLLSFSGLSFACDNCNVYLNQSPNDYRNSIGLYMRQRVMYGEYDFFGQMITTLHAGHGNDKALWGKNVRETYQNYELRGSYYFRERWKTSVIIPIVNNQQKIDDVVRFQVRNIGDPMILQSFQLFNTKKDTGNSDFSQRFVVGAGIKFPLGKTNLKYEQGIPNLDLQPGTGSWDLITYVSYGIKWKTIGMNTLINVKNNGKDQNNYRYGTSFNSRINLFNDFELRRITIRLQSGLYLEHAFMDAFYDAYSKDRTVHSETGGSVLFANAAIQFYLRDFMLFGEFQKMLKSELNGYSQLLTNYQFNLGLTYNF